MNVKITINTPKSLIEGYTGHITLPSGRQIKLIDYCGGAVVAFSSKAALIKAAQRVAKENFERAE